MAGSVVGHVIAGSLMGGGGHREEAAPAPAAAPAAPLQTEPTRQDPCYDLFKCMFLRIYMALFIVGCRKEYPLSIIK